MSALQLELYTDYTPKAEKNVSSCHLRLETVSAAPAQRRPSSSARRKRAYRRDSLWFTVAVIAIAGFAITSFISSTILQARSSYAASASALPQLSVNVTVHQGDTLWKYAHKYGSPDNYVLDDVETIARANNLSVGSPLSPGQHLHIPVTNPTLAAQIEAKQRSVVAAR